MAEAECELSNRLIKALTDDFASFAVRVRAEQREVDARAVCSICRTVYETPDRILCGPATQGDDGFWRHWFTKGEHKGEFAGHCEANAIRLDSAHQQVNSATSDEILLELITIQSDRLRDAAQMLGREWNGTFNDGHVKVIALQRISRRETRNQ